MFDRVTDFLGRKLSGFLMKEIRGCEHCTTNSAAALRAVIRPGDVLLVEGNARVSTAIKYLTQSTWSHAALYTGPIAGRTTASGEPHVLVEANLGSGVTSAPLSIYAHTHARICRPTKLRDEDRDRVVAFAIDRIGIDYDLRNIIDLARFLLPTPPVPTRWRRRMLAMGSGLPTRVICSTLIAQAFEAVRYPILPRVETLDDNPSAMMLAAEILHIRHHSLYTPRDFDLSPYFATIKPTLELGFDYRDAIWADEPKMVETAV